MYLLSFDEYNNVEAAASNNSANVNAAILAATGTLSSKLGADFCFGISRDYFSLPPIAGAEKSNFRLSRSLAYGSCLLRAGSGDFDWNTGVSIGKQFYTVDAARGIVSITRPLGVAYEWISVQAEVGFLTNRDRVYQNVPGWLHSAAILQTAYILRMANIRRQAVNDHIRAESVPVANEIRKILQPYLRPSLNIRTPSYSLAL